MGALVKRLRKECEFTFDAFVEETGLGRGYISELERGLVVPTIHSLAKIARALDVTVADLVVGSSERERLFTLCRELSPDDVRWLLAKAKERAPPEALARLNDSSGAADPRAPPPTAPAVDGALSPRASPSTPPLPGSRASPSTPPPPGRAAPPAPLPPSASPPPADGSDSKSAPETPGAATDGTPRN
ncbi:MAG TPA: helix-turn-helix transcriptional regulator [Polyangiaceae bacterium]|nr:helix-turn-helix transcriptional regulator [Polyangiaceae bacterium]